MFKSLKNALGWGQEKDNLSDAPVVPQANSASAEAAERGAGSAQTLIAQWAATQGLKFTNKGKNYALESKLHGRPWRLEIGAPSRDFITGLELRARGEMNVRDDVAVMVMTRKLKNELDKRAFSLYTDTLQTQVDPHLPEEMRWLSMYEEVGWEQLGHEFLDQYAILADAQENALAWVTPALVEKLVAWPGSEPNVPKVLMVLRGKVYLRMQLRHDDVLTLSHATGVFTAACDAAVASFAVDLEI